MTKEELNKLNESIKHCEDVISNLKLKENCDKCLKQHEQLKKWLIEYKNLINPQPYKFEDLKPNIWVYGNKFKEICWIEFVDRISTGNGLIKIIWGEYLKSHLQGDYILRTEFEENRFYPVIIGGEG